MLRAAGVDPSRFYGTLQIGAPDLLTGEARRQTIRVRDAWLGESAEP